MTLQLVASRKPVARKTTWRFDGCLYSNASHLECEAEVVRLEQDGVIHNDGDGWPEGMLADGYIDDPQLSTEWIDFYGGRP